MSGRIPAQIAVFLSASTLGGSFVATRYLMADAAPSTLAFLRFGLALVCLLPFVPWRQFRQWRRRDLLILVIIGLLQFGIFHYFINSALAIIPASRGAVIFAMIPILTMLIAALFRVEPLQLRRLAAGLLAVLGVGLALSEKAFVSTGAAGNWTGELLFLAAVCCGGTYNALSARILVSYGVVSVTFLAMSSGVALLAAGAVQEGLLTTWPAFSLGSWLLILFLAVPAGALAFFLFNWGLQRLSPAGAAIFVPVAPMTATLLGWLLLDEIISPLFLIGLACVIGGILLVNRQRR